MGVGLMEGFKQGVNWKLFGKQFLSWVCTLFVVGLAVAAVFSQVTMAAATQLHRAGPAK